MLLLKPIPIIFKIDIKMKMMKNETRKNLNVTEMAVGKCVWI